MRRTITATIVAVLLATPSASFAQSSGSSQPPIVAGTAAPAPGMTPLTEAELRAALVGHTISGTNPAGWQYNDTFQANGALTGNGYDPTNRPGADSGSWRIHTGTGRYHAGVACQTWQTWPAACFGLVKDATGTIRRWNGEAVTIR